MRRVTLIALPAMLFCLAAAGLEIGVASCDITPDPAKYTVPLAGYGAREGKPATGIHDRLHAKVMFLRDAETRMALVTTDLRCVTPELKTQIVNAVGALGITADNLMVCASHTHDGPAMYPQEFWQVQFGKYDPRIVVEMSAAIADALRTAEKAAAPAKVGFGQADVDGFTNNRRWTYDTAAREAGGETPCIRPRLWVMRVDGSDGAPKALVVNFATHPTILGAENMLISAEWPGALQKKLESQFPGVTAFYTNGADGDQSPNAKDGQDDFERVVRFGEAVADKAAGLFRTIETKPGAPIAFARVTPDLPTITFSPTAASGRFRNLQDVAKRDLPDTAEIQILRIGDSALVGLPGEPLCVVGGMVEDAVRGAGVPNAIIIGLANDYVGYIVDSNEYRHGGYEVDARSYYGPELGRFMADHAAEAVKGLR